VDGYSGDAGNALMTSYNVLFIANGMKFTTADSDNDLQSVNCAAAEWWAGGWWYRQCGTSVVNRDDLAIWKTVDDIKDVQASRMLVKLN